MLCCRSSKMPWRIIKKTERGGVQTCPRRVTASRHTALLMLVTELVMILLRVLVACVHSRHVYFNLQGDSFYTLFPDGQYGSAAYMAKAVVNRILQAGLHYDPAKSCCLS